METNIHPTAMVDKAAKLGLRVKIGPYATIGPKVCLGDDVEVFSHGMVLGKTTIGAGSKIFPFATVGMIPQDLKYRGEDSEFIAGARNTFREYCNVSIGTETGCMKTVVGSDNLFMAFTHIAHDCVIGNHCILANSVQLAGHVEIHDRAIVGGCSAIHQFTKIGTLAMVGGGSMLTQDVPPFCTVSGNRATAGGLNLVGLKRYGVEGGALEEVKKMYKILFHSTQTLPQAIADIEKEILGSPLRTLFIDFLRQSTRGLCR